jgi:hypothetical protein
MDDTPTVTPATNETGVQGDEIRRAERIEITQGGIRDARAGSITLTEGGITTATAETIDVHQGGIVQATASDIAVDTGGIVLAQGETVSLDRGAIGAAIGGEVRVVQSAANLVGARDTIIDQSLVMSLVGVDVTIRQPSAIGVLIAGRVDGTVRPILDWRGALAFGVAFAVVSGILRRR